MPAIFLCSRVVKKQIECQDFTRKRTKCRAKLEKSVVSWSVNAMLFCVALLPLHEKKKMQKAALGIVVRRPFPLLWMSVYTTLEIVGFVQELGEWSDAAEENMKKIT